MKNKQFLILSTQRTGSTLFCLWLNSHSDVRCHGEVFLKKSGAMDSITHFYSGNVSRRLLYQSGYNPFAKRIPFNPVLNHLSKEFLDSLLNRETHSAPWTDPQSWHEFYPQDPSNRALVVGFKIMYNTLDNLRWLRRCVRQDGYHVIHLERENQLKSYVSYMRLRQTKQSSVSDASKINRVQVKVNIHHMLSVFRGMEKTKKAYRDYFCRNPLMECSYEEFMSDRRALQVRVSDFLELDDVELQMPTLQKISKGNLRDNIANYDDVIKALRGTGYSHYLDEA